MIVSCPSCGTRYRHEATEEELARQARCSRCEHEFPLAQARRCYVLLSSRSTAGGPSVPSGLSIGMDDPQLAKSLAATALDSADGAPAAMTYATVADESSAKPAGDARKRDKSPSMSERMAPSAGHRNPLREFLVALLLATVGAAAGYFGALEQELDPLRWAPAGAAVGLLFGWAWVRWAARRR